MPNLAGNKHFPVHFFLQRQRLSHLSMEKVRVRSVGIGHQIGYSRAGTKNKNINKDERDFPWEEIKKIYQKNKWNT